MAEPNLEGAWNAFCEANGFERFDLVPKEYQGKKALYLEILQKRVDRVLIHPPHSLEEFGLKLVSEIKDHDIKADEVTVYLGTVDKPPTDKVGGKAY